MAQGHKIGGKLNNSMAERLSEKEVQHLTKVCASVVVVVVVVVCVCVCVRAS